MLSQLQADAKSALVRVLNRLGYEVRRTRASSHRHRDAIEDQRWLLQTADPLILDVGANRGQSVRRYLSAFPAAEVFAFEPGEAAYLELRSRFASNPRIHPIRQALSDSIGQATFHVNRADFTSSLLPAAGGCGQVVDPDLLAEVGQVQVMTSTIADFCRQERISKVGILKLDVQGAELLVLKGADPLLSREAVSIVFTEVQFAALYEGQCFFGEVAEFLRQRGYELFGLYDLNYGVNGVLGWADALFVNQACLASRRSPGDQVRSGSPGGRANELP